MGLEMRDLIKRAAEDLRKARYAIALSGAGISTESGIPDFRGPSGIWSKDPDAERRAYQSYGKFLEDPRGYWEDRLSARSLLGDLEKAEPNPGHYALAELERVGILKCLITQNIDGLHEKAGSRNVIEYHGGYFKLRCSKCGLRFGIKEIDLEKLRKEEGLPPLCECGGVIKSDVVHFREPIPVDVARSSQEETWKCDLMLICGTSAVVYPFAQLPRLAKKHMVEKETKTESNLYIVKQVPAATIIEVNAEPTPLTEEGISDYLIQGKTGELLPELVQEVKRIMI
jgi:NAD-dependent deacetylase